MSEVKRQQVQVVTEACRWFHPVNEIERKAIERWAERRGLFPELRQAVLDLIALAPPTFVYDDGGRADAGYKGKAGDCVCRAIAIVTQKPYREVYDGLNEAAERERPRGRLRSSSRTGVQKPTIRRYLHGLGYTWTPTMAIGVGTTVHLRADELPSGRLIVLVSRHVTTMIDGVVHDTHDPTRGGRRCVYGYWRLSEMPWCTCGHPNTTHGLGHPCKQPRCDCRVYVASREHIES